MQELSLLCLIYRMIARTKAPCRIPSPLPVMIRLIVGLRARRQSKIHQMCYRGLPLPATCGLHGHLQMGKQRFSHRPSESDDEDEVDKLTDSAAVSSSASLNRRWPLCCFRRD